MIEFVAPVTLFAMCWAENSLMLSSTPGGVRTAIAKPDGCKCEFAICLQVAAEVTSGAVRKKLLSVSFSTVL